MPGSLNELNQELEKAGRVVDFIELGELMGRCISSNRVARGEESQTMKEKLCVKTTSLIMCLHGNIQESHQMQICTRKN